MPENVVLIDAYPLKTLARSAEHLLPGVPCTELSRPNCHSAQREASATLRTMRDATIQRSSRQECHARLFVLMLVIVANCDYIIGRLQDSSTQRRNFRCCYAMLDVVLLHTDFKPIGPSRCCANVCAKVACKCFILTDLEQ